MVASRFSNVFSTEHQPPTIFFSTPGWLFFLLPTHLCRNAKSHTKLKHSQVWTARTCQYSQFSMCPTEQGTSLDTTELSLDRWRCCMFPARVFPNTPIMKITQGSQTDTRLNKTWFNQYPLHILIWSIYTRYTWDSLLTVLRAPGRPAQSVSSSKGQGQHLYRKAYCLSEEQSQLSLHIRCIA